MNHIIKLLFAVSIASLLMGCGEKNTSATSNNATGTEQTAAPAVNKMDPAEMYTRAAQLRDDWKTAEALELFTQAADMGERDSMFMLGIMYENGESVPVDEQKAIELLTKSAQLGNGSAPARLKALKAKMAKAAKK